MRGQNVPGASHSVLNTVTCLPKAKREAKLGNGPNEGNWMSRYPPNAARHQPEAPGVSVPRKGHSFILSPREWQPLWVPSLYNP